MRWALASLGEKDKFDLVGIWIDKSWQKIRRDLNHRLNYSCLEVLFSDGGPGIEESLLDPGMRHQRCLWHGKRDFPYILYVDKFLPKADPCPLKTCPTKIGRRVGRRAPLAEKKPQQESLKDKLKSIPAMNLTRSGLEQLTPEDSPKLKELAEKTKQGFKELIRALPEEKYPAARTYIVNLSRNVTTFFPRRVSVISGLLIKSGFL